MTHRILTAPLRLLVPGLLSLLHPRKDRLPTPLPAQRDATPARPETVDNWLFSSEQEVNRAADALSWELDQMAEMLGRVRTILTASMVYMPFETEAVSSTAAPLMDDEMLFDGVMNAAKGARLEVFGEVDELFHDQGALVPVAGSGESLQQVA